MIAVAGVQVIALLEAVLFLQSWLLAMSFYLLLAPLSWTIWMGRFWVQFWFQVVRRLVRWSIHGMGSRFAIATSLLNPLQVTSFGKSQDEKRM